jgi:antitoxin ParD1/3/4
MIHIANHERFMPTKEDEMELSESTTLARQPVDLTTIDNASHHAGMSSNTMSFALPEAMRSYVDERVRSGQYGNTSEYLRELIRRDQEEQAKKRLRELIEEGLNSGPGRALNAKRAAQLKKHALGDPQ